MTGVIQNALEAVVDSPFLKHCDDYITFLKINTFCQEHLASLAAHMNELIKTVRANVTQGNSEQMWIDFNKVVRDKEYIEKSASLIFSFCDSMAKTPCVKFSACLHRRLIESVAVQQRKAVSESPAKLSSQSQTEVSTHEKGVVFYIAGHMLFRMLRRAPKKAAVLESLRSHSDSTSVCSEIKEWTHCQDRGGLTEPSTGFFELVLACESLIRQRLTGSIKATSMDRLQIKESLLSNSEVQLQWQTLVVGHQGLLESFIDLYLRIRGHAVAKTVQQQHLDKLKQTCKKSASLRHGLKKHVPRI